MNGTMQPRTLGEIAQYVGGRVVGDPGLVIRAAATLGEAREGDISFLANRRYEKLLESTQAGAVIVGQELPGARVALLVADDPYFAFAQALVFLYGYRRHKEVGVSPRASIAPSAKLGAGCHVHDFVTIAEDVVIGSGCILYPGVFIGAGTRIGDECILYPNVTVYDGSTLGQRVIVNANSTVGVDGFGYATHEGVHHKIPQVGGVVLEDDVEIGSSCSIERGTLGDTVIGQGSKLGDLVTIGHGTRVGPHCLLVAQVGIAGSTTVGHHCTIGGQAGIVGHITIGNHVTIGGRAGVVNSLPDGETVLGAPAIEAGEARRSYMMIPYLPQMRQDIRNLQNDVQHLRAALKDTPEGPTEQQEAK
jgi:UDP-3-O-[3-hydroxymyristoyl] glucosamine N-acyltransferase